MPDLMRKEKLRAVAVAIVAMGLVAGFPARAQDTPPKAQEQNV